MTSKAVTYPCSSNASIRSASSRGVVIQVSLALCGRERTHAERTHSRDEREGRLQRSTPAGRPCKRAQLQRCPVVPWHCGAAGCCSTPRSRGLPACLQPGQTEDVRRAHSASCAASRPTYWTDPGPPRACSITQGALRSAGARSTRAAGTPRRVPILVCIEYSTVGAYAAVYYIRIYMYY